MALNNPRAAQDVLRVRTGKDGALFLISQEGPILISESNEFRLSVSFQNTDWQPVGSALVFGVFTGYTVSITLTETTIRDDLLLEPILESINESGPNGTVYNFQTLLVGRDGKDQRINIRNCFPDGDVDLINLTPGEIVQHPWTFRANAQPELLEKLSIDY